MTKILFVFCEVSIHLLALKTIIGFKFPWEDRQKPEVIDNESILEQQARLIAEFTSGVRGAIPLADDYDRATRFIAHRASG